MRQLILVIALLMTLAVGPVVQGQGGADPLPPAALLEGFEHIYQGWNNCGPATLAMALSFYESAADQAVAAAWLKPDPEDKNVSADQMVAYVNAFTDVRALVRFGGSLEQLKQLIVTRFPVIVAAGYEPPGEDWMGHYLLVAGYDDGAGTLITQDSYQGPDTVYSQAELDGYWRHFNRVYIVLYPPERESELLALLAEDALPDANALRARETARQEAVVNPDDPFAWFNLGTSFMLLGQYAEAVVAFDQARNAGDGLPWRMLWYQFGPFEAYYHTGRFDDVLALAQYNLATTPEGEHPIEETYYYAGLARAALQEADRARLNLQQALLINPNFEPAREAMARIMQDTD